MLLRILSGRQWEEKFININGLSAKEKADMTYKDIKKKLYDKKYKQRKALQEAIATSTEGYER